MIFTWLRNVLTRMPRDTMDRYRRHFLRSDARQTVAGLACVSLPVLLFSYSDFILFGRSDLFFLLLSLRIFLLLDVVLLSYYLLARVRHPAAMDRMVLAMGLLFVAFCVFLGFTRPASYIEYAYLDIVLVLSVFLFFTFGLAVRAAVAGALALGDIGTLLFFKGPLRDGTIGIVLACYIVAYFVGLVFAVRYESARRRQYLMLAEEQEMRQQMARLAEVDDLTGIWNRRKFMELFEAEIVRLNRYGRPFALLMLDLDDFKHVNDRYGHLAGDVVLRMFAETVRGQVRGTDIFGRLGGEEFGIVLPETGLQDARLMGERIRIALKDSNMLLDSGDPVSITVSIGVAEASVGHPSLDATMSLADASLYRAKALGRDRVVWVEGGVEHAGLGG